MKVPNKLRPAPVNKHVVAYPDPTKWKAHATLIPPGDSGGWAKQSRPGIHEDFEMVDNRDREDIIALGNYVKFKPNSLILDTGLEIKAKDIFTQYFVYSALAEANRENKLDEGIDINGPIDVIDHRNKKGSYSLNCVLIQAGAYHIYIKTLEGYTLTFSITDNLKKLCNKEDLNERH